MGNMSRERGLFEVSLVAASYGQALMGVSFMPFLFSPPQPVTFSAVHASTFNIMNLYWLYGYKVDEAKWLLRHWHRPS